MHIQDYFRNIQSNKLSEAEKNALYERILRNTQYQKPIFSRARFYVKVAGYMTFLWVLALSIYIPFLGQNSEQWVQTANVVNAGYIAKVVTVEWDYYIESNWNRIDGRNISAGDSITLSENASLVVLVWDKVEGKIVWPATFVVDQNSTNWYEITLKKWDFIEITTIGDQSQSPEVAVISETHKFTARGKAGKWLHVVLTEENEKPLLVNKSQEEIEVTKEQDPDKKIFLAENKSISVGTYIFATTVAPSEVAKIVARTNNDESAMLMEDNYDRSFFRGLIVANSNTPSESSADAMASTMSMKAVEDAPQYDNEAVRVSLLPQFVRVDIKYVTFYYLNWQEKEFQISYENLLKRVYNLYDAYQLEIPAEWIMSSQKEWYSLEKVLILARNLQEKIPSQTSEHNKSTLNTIVTFLDRLSQKNFWEYKWSDLSLEQMFEKIQ